MPGWQCSREGIPLVNVGMALVTAKEAVMHVKRISISKVNPAPYNPRKDLQPGDPEYEKLKLSMAQFGCVEPLVWNKRTGNLVGGHQRFKILLEQGATE